MNVLVPNDALNRIFAGVSEFKEIQEASPAHAQEAIGAVIDALTLTR